MVPCAFAIPGDIELPTGGYAYDRRLIELLPQFGIDVEHVSLISRFPNPTKLDLCATAQALAGKQAGTVMLIDGLAYGAFSTATLDSIPQPIVALVHHPLAFETGLHAERAAALLDSETAALMRAHSVVVTSAATKALLVSDLAVAAHRITIAEPGTDPASRSIGSQSGRVNILAVGSIVPRKGYTILIEALATLKALPWSLTIVGAARDRAELRKVEAAIDAAGLGDRVELEGAVDDTELARLYSAADLFVMPSLFEGYGMVLAEALARGLPIVCTTGGAAASTVPNAAALKVPPGDAAALAAALTRVVSDGGLRQALSDAAWSAAADLPRWSDTARIVADVIKDASR